MTSKTLRVSRTGQPDTLYAYDSLMRMTNVCFGTLSIDYGYLPHTRLPESVVNSCGIGWQHVYEKDRNLIASVTNFSGETAVAAFGYVNDALGRRIARNNDAFAYNARSELTNALMNAGGYGYVYDGIGNLLFSAAGNVTNTYTANSLNQYAAIAGGMTVSPTFDADGNMSWDGRFIFTWDAENRLVSAMSNGVCVVTNIYDHQSRRIAKITPEETSAFIWDSWNIIREVRDQGSAASTNHYVWGLDLSSRPQGAGGVGGLLAEIIKGVPYFPCFDANGNATEYVNENGNVRAHYEYSPFGEITVQTGDMADAFTHRFSTKPFDAETGLAMYQLRPYQPDLGRWLCRDPIEETGGLNLYGMLSNQPLGNVDNLGLSMHFNIPALLNKLLIALNNAKTAIREAKDCLRMLNHWRKGGNEQNTNDKYRHCLASCDINRSCGIAIARATGFMKEAYDLFRGYVQISADYWLPINIAVELDVLLQGGDFQDSVEDFTANEIGIKCAKSPDRCSKCCCDVYAP